MLYLVSLLVRQLTIYLSCFLMHREQPLWTMYLSVMTLVPTLQHLESFSSSSMCLATSSTWANGEPTFDKYPSKSLDAAHCTVEVGLGSRYSPVLPTTRVPFLHALTSIAAVLRLTPPWPTIVLKTGTCKAKCTKGAHGWKASDDLGVQLEINSALDRPILTKRDNSSPPVLQFSNYIMNHAARWSKFPLLSRPT